MSNRGIITTYSIDKDYFVYGDAYRLKLGVNNYVNAICIKVDDNSVTFGYYNKNAFESLRLSIDQLMYGNRYEIRRLMVDYAYGEFKFEV